MKKFFLLLLSLFFLSNVSFADTKSIKGVQDDINNIFNIVQNETEIKEKTDSIQKITDKIFDWELLSKYALAKNWESFTKEQKKEFVSAFKDLIFKTYVSKLKGDNKSYKIEFSKEIKTKGKKATFYTVVTGKDFKVKIGYLLSLNNKEWRIYNISIENLNLLTNYREQFKSFLRNHSAEELIKELKEKAGGLDV